MGEHPSSLFHAAAAGAGQLAVPHDQLHIWGLQDAPAHRAASTDMTAAGRVMHQCSDPGGSTQPCCYGCLNGACLHAQRLCMHSKGRCQAPIPLQHGLPSAHW